ncbi:MAG: hypothetical protein CMH57_12975 [Myxococcales bacterium]|nr:hypothetical protein [Myxococcales bacterium]
MIIAALTTVEVTAQELELREPLTTVTFQGDAALQVQLKASDEHVPAGTSREEGELVFVSAEGSREGVYRKMCLTPCALELPRGPHTLRVTSSDRMMSFPKYIELRLEEDAQRWELEDATPWLAASGIGLTSISGAALVVGSGLVLLVPDEELPYSKKPVKVAVAISVPTLLLGVWALWAGLPSAEQIE